MDTDKIKEKTTVYEQSAMCICLVMIIIIIIWLILNKFAPSKYNYLVNNDKIPSILKNQQFLMTLMILIFSTIGGLNLYSALN
jgi:hypothetical protein